MPVNYENMAIDILISIITGLVWEHHCLLTESLNRTLMVRFLKKNFPL
jgi:hypothetical protein